MNRFTKQLLPFCSLIFIISLCTFLEPDNFLTTQNLVNVLCRSSINGIMAAGMTYIIITGGIDLSVGSMLAMCGMFGAASMLYFSGGNWEPISTGSYIHMGLLAMIGGTLVSILFGAICGFLNGTLITRLKLAPFIVTLGTMSIFRGISYIMNKGKPFAVQDYMIQPVSSAFCFVSFSRSAAGSTRPFSGRKIAPASHTMEGAGTPSSLA